MHDQVCQQSCGCVTDCTSHPVSSALHARARVCLRNPINDKYKLQTRETRTQCGSVSRGNWCTAKAGSPLSFFAPTGMTSYLLSGCEGV